MTAMTGAATTPQTRRARADGAQTRIVIVNPNTSQAVTDLLVREARTAASPDLEVTGVTADAGVPAIDTPEAAEAAGRAIVSNFLRAGTAGVGIIGGFVDPGLAAARERVPFPVIGMGEAAMLTACLLGPRFAVVTVGESTAGVIEAVIEQYALHGRTSGVRAVPGTLPDVIADQASFDEACIDAANEAVAASGADTVVLGGAMFAGMARRIAPRVTVPVVDPIRAAMLQAETLARLAPAGAGE